MDTAQARVILWTAPRSLSTVFYRAITNAPDTNGIFEPYNTVCGYRSCNESSVKERESHKDVKLRLDQPNTDNGVIFVKDMAYCLMSSNHNIQDILPETYVHTLLIRDPRKTIPSLYKVFIDGNYSGWEEFYKKNDGVKALYDLYTIVTEELGLQCVVVDADDLEQNPGGVLKAYCDCVGITFHPSMIHWNMADHSNVKAFNEATAKKMNTSWFQTVRTATSFVTSAERPSSTYSSYSIFCQEKVAASMQYYELLYNKRIGI